MQNKCILITHTESQIQLSAYSISDKIKSQETTCYYPVVAETILFEGIDSHESLKTMTQMCVERLHLVMRYVRLRKYFGCNSLTKNTVNSLPTNFVLRINFV